jgi:cbb3-type cytochrome oxidase subunit 3
MGIFKFGVISSLIYTFGDTITTYLNYGRAGVVEGNPIIQILINFGWLYFFTIKLGLFIFFVAGTTYLYRKRKKLARGSAAVILILGLFTIFNNTLLI